MRCQHNPDAVVGYIHTSTLEVSGTSVRCQCDVVGLTSSGAHGTFTNPLPTGACSIVVTRCPTSRTLL